ncbi:MAG: bifunctional phosphopantothenoylcysteine decarboxylase/phosphopantothenate--cysteine ligase CoaBC [Anaerolineales bacterium]|nr:bifunctional phosphopantothenoylcysteine decarboxylase/phosphopantothenate--cysteine ligase CoaBC [Anaerolineales bacterium]
MTLPQTIPLFKGRRILLGITGSIAAYKAADLASKLTQAGAQVEVLLSEAAQKFISPLTFQSVTGRRAYTDKDLWSTEAHILHVGLAEYADLLIIAPATANTLAKIAHGQADSLITITALAAKCPMLVAPAMDANMFEQPVTQSNIETLIGRGVAIVGPVEGRMASGQIGLGRFIEPDELLGHIRLALGRHGPLEGLRVIVTAAGTQEPIDSVRSIANSSSGKQGYALAQAAIDRGAEVTLISGVSHLSPPIGAEVISLRTAAEMQQAVLEHVEKTDVLLMAAAVADFRPIKVHVEKLKKSKGIPDIKLEPTEDILGLVAQKQEANGWPRLSVGFAAESENLVDNARAKLEEKNLSLIVANDISLPDAGFEVDTNRVTLIDSEGGVQELPLMSKVEVSEVVLQRVIQLLETLE